jgi:hypothetical protein
VAAFALQVKKGSLASCLIPLKAIVVSTRGEGYESLIIKITEIWRVHLMIVGRMHNPDSMDPPLRKPRQYVATVPQETVDRRFKEAASILYMPRLKT